MKPRLVSYKLCPFVQRVNIVLLKKQVDYDLQYVDLSDPPDWFLSLSPFKRVPLLQVDEGIIFESAAIVEYIDERYDPVLHPQDPFKRAQNRSWIEESSEITWYAFHLSAKETKEEFDKVCRELGDKLEKMELFLGNTPFINGSEFSLVDATYAPFFQRITFLEELSPGIIDQARFPKICAWREALLNDAAVRNSHVPDIRPRYYELVAKRKGYISQFLDPETYAHIGSKSVY